MSGRAGDISVLRDADALATAAADRLTLWLAEAMAARGTAHVALTGGSSATGLYRELRALPAEALDWAHVHLWWGDDRYVPLDHPQSNAGTAYALLGIGEVAGGGLAAEERVPLQAANVHPVTNGEGGAARAAERYEAEIRAHLPADDQGRPSFDVILLGMGPDGHILSVFPGSEALEPGVPTVMPIPAPTHVEPHVERVTVTPAVLGAAGHVLVMVSGAAKAGMVHQVLEGERDPRRWPAQLAILPQAVWLLDAGSAAELEAAGTKGAG